MKKLICILLVSIMLLASGCTGSMFAVVLAKRSVPKADAREAAAEKAEAAGVIGLTESLFPALYKEGENLAYSPVSIWLALAMLAETTAGETRDEILAALGADSIEKARTAAETLITAETFKEKGGECAIANSLWMNGSINYNRDTLDTIGESFGADSFSGDPADPKYSKALREWLDRNTNGLLKDCVENVSLDPSTVLAIASTVYFDAEWEDEFKKDSNSQGVFRSPQGEITCEFMHKTEQLYYAEGEGFRAVGKTMKGGTVMWFILPDEGAALTTAVSGFSALDSAERCEVRFTMPKLDVTSDLDLIPALRSLGISRCFVPGEADFSPLTEDDMQIFVDSAAHAARIKADEKRVRAAAFTLLMPKAASAPSQIEFTLDRPFLFAVTGATGAPLFAGAVNIPGS